MKQKSPRRAHRRARTRPVPMASVKAPFEPANDPVVGDPTRPGGPGLYLHWDGRRTYRTRMPAPRVLQTVQKLSHGTPDGSRIIEGDNLQVMVSLRSQYRGSVDVAYLDPPYNTGKNDFRYSDRRFQDPNADSDDAVYVTNEDGGRHTKWLNYIGPRLYLTWELLSDHGVCFVSINDIELFRLGLLMDEIFGESNRLGVLVWKQQVDNNPTRIAVEHEYILCYAKRADAVPEQWTSVDPAKQWLLATYERLKSEDLNVSKLEAAYRLAIREQKAAHRAAVAKGRGDEVIDPGRMERYRHVDKRGPWAKDWHLENPKPGGYLYDVIHPVSKKPCKKPPNGYRYSPESMKQLLSQDRIVFGKDHTEPAQLRRYLKDSSSPLRSVISLPGRLGADTLNALLPDVEFRHPKPVELIELLVRTAGDLDSLVLDPFAGSGTTAQSVLRLNAQDGGVRRFILIEEGTAEDRYCRTVTAPRVKAAMKKENLGGGYSFEESGRRLNRAAILELERETISSLILQTDVTGVGRGITKVGGTYVIGQNSRREAICLCWNGRAESTVTREVLVAMYDEVKSLGLSKPMRVYGSTCTVGETDSFRFCQIPDEILAALQLLDDDEDQRAQERPAK